MGFIKDQSIDKVQFPPKILQKFDTGVPIGHLRPLGKYTEIMSMKIYMKISIRLSA